MYLLVFFFPLKILLKYSWFTLFIKKKFWSVVDLNIATPNCIFQLILFFFPFTFCDLIISFYSASPFWPAVFLYWSQLIAFWRFPSNELCFYFAAFRILSLFLTFAIFIMSWSRSIWVHLVWDLLCFLYLDMFPSLGLGNFQP